MVRDQSGRPASTTLTPSVVKSVKTPADRTDHGTVKNLTLTKEPILEVNDAQYKVASVKVNDNDNAIPSMYQPILMSDSVRREITTQHHLVARELLQLQTILYYGQWTTLLVQQCV